MNKPLRLRRELANRQNNLPLTRQCGLLGIHRSGLYYTPCGETELNLELMRLMDQRFMEKPWEGVPRMTKWLRMDKGYTVNPKRIERLYKVMVFRHWVRNPIPPNRGRTTKSIPTCFAGLP